MPSVVSKISGGHNKGRRRLLSKKIVWRYLPVKKKKKNVFLGYKNIMSKIDAATNDIHYMREDLRVKCLRRMKERENRNGPKKKR